MPTTIPPTPPKTGQQSPEARINFRAQQIFFSIVTIGLTCWMWHIHPVLGIAATFIAKHVLVAILASGLNYLSAAEPTPPEPRTAES